MFGGLANFAYLCAVNQSDTDMEATQLIKNIARNDPYRRDIVLRHFGESKEELDKNLIVNLAGSGALASVDFPLPFDIPQGDYYCREGEPMSDRTEGYEYPAKELQADHKVSVTDGSITRTYHLYRID